MFATLTAPSFGPVHSRRMRGKTVLPCRPRRDANARRCPHGRDISCPTRHVEDDPRLGQPMCGDCYDYEAAVLFNAYAADLWRRFTTYLPRHLARLAGVTQKALRAWSRIRFVKVAEYQARGVVHFHAVIRLDAPGEDYQPPPAAYHRRAAVRRHRPGRRRRRPRHRARRPGREARLRRADRRPAHPPRHDLPGTGQALDGQAVANYIAKYATKTLTAPGVPAHRYPARGRHRAACAAPAHYRRHDHHRLAARQQTATGQPRFRQWAHMLGYGGHFLTKSRRYSVTFGQLRAARTEHRRAAAPPRTANATPGAAPSMRPSSWSSTPGPTPEPATARLRPALSWRCRRPTWHADINP